MLESAEYLEYLGHSAHVTNVAFSFDDAFLATTGGDDSWFGRISHVGMPILSWVSFQRVPVEDALTKAAALLKYSCACDSGVTISLPTIYLNGRCPIL